MENGFDNEWLKRSHSSVNLRRFESPRGKSINWRWIMRRWSHNIIFKNISSKVEVDLPSSGFTRKARGKWFGMVACQIFVREWKRI
jgi:hypothetical protein